MDTSLKLNRWFIETAVKTAIKKLRAEEDQQREDDELKLEAALPVDPNELTVMNPDADPADADIVYQWGAQGHIGASMIAETILERIEACGVFIADLTFTTNVTTADDRMKKVPNANVLIEVGAASRTGTGWDRIILVMNTHYGPVEELPFDLRHRLCQVKYTLTGWDDPNRVKTAKRLAEDIAAQLRPMYRRTMDSLQQQRKAAEASKRADEGARAKRLRSDFEAKLTEGTYREYGKKDRPILALTIIPSKPSPPIEFPSDFLMRHGDELRPMWVNHPEPSRDMNSILFLDAVESGSLVESMTEMTSEGVIYSANRWTQHPNDDAHFYMNECEPEMLHAVFRYLRQSKSLGIEGPWQVGFSLLNAKGCQLIPGQRTPKDYWPRPYGGESVVPELVDVPAHYQQLDCQQFVKLFKRSLDQFWQAFRHPRDSCFSEDRGRYVGAFCG